MEAQSADKMESTERIKRRGEHSRKERQPAEEEEEEEEENEDDTLIPAKLSVHGVKKLLFIDSEIILTQRLLGNHTKGENVIFSDFG